MDTVIEILIDISGSMGTMTGQGTQHENKYLLPDGSTRITLAKKILTQEILPTIDYAATVIIKTFKSEHTLEQKPSIVKIYDGKFDSVLINRTFTSLPNDTTVGGTPISAAIAEALNDLKGKEYLDKERAIILVTDGEENGGGDYKSVAEQALNVDGIKCKVHVVGISLSDQAEIKAKGLAGITQGFYLPLKAANYNALEIKKVLTPLKESVVKNSLQNIKTTEIVQTSTTKKKIEVLEKKLETFQKDAENPSFDNQLNKIQSQIEGYITNSQNLLREIETLKKIITELKKSHAGIDSTTLTIDPDYSESIRKRSEAFVFKILINKYGEAKVKWMNINGESYCSYDFAILDENGNVVNVIECVGTPQSKATFYLTSIEWDYFLKNREKYQIYRVFNVESNITYICIENLLSALLKGKVVPYLLAPEILKEKRIFLTLVNS